MELPPILVDTYRRYKKETEVFVNWLASTARSTGTVDDVFADDSNNTEAVATGRLKGKARKAAKAQATTSFEIPVKAFTKLAAAIVAKKIDVPKPMVDILRDIIRARKECAQFYRPRQTDRTEDKKSADDGHTFFITVLEEVSATLRSNFPERTRRAQETEKNTEQLANAFEYLDLEEPTETTTKGKTHSKPQFPKPQTTYKLKSDEDVAFAIFCFFKDVTDVRLFVRRTWRQFKDGLITLETAALTMKSACSLIQQLNTEFIKIYPKFEEHYEIGEFMKTTHFHPDRQFQQSVASSFWAAYTDGNQTFPYHGVSCDHAGRILRTFILCRGKLHSGMVLTASEVIVAKCLVQLRTIAEISDLGPLELFEQDPVVKAIKEVVKTRKIPSWTVFTVQLFWDTQREFGAEIGRVFLSAQSTAQWILGSFEEYLALEGIKEFGNYHKHNYAEIVEHKEQTKGLFNSDIVQEIIDSVGWKGEKPRIWESHFLLRHHPMLCGLLSQHIIAMFQANAIGMAGCQGTILSAAHFYNAAVHTGLLPAQTKWVDMDWVVEKQGEDHIFVGARPISAPKFSLHHNLAFGTPISRFTRDARHTGRITLKTDNRLLKYMSNYQLATLHKSGKIVERTRVAGDGGALMESILTRSQNCKVAHNEKSSSKNDKKVSKMTPVEMLTAFRKVLQEDELPLRFDMMQMYFRCLRLLKQIRSQVTSQAPLDYPSSGNPCETDLIRCVSNLLSELDGGRMYNNPQAVGAAKILGDFIKKEGDAGYSQAVSRIPQISEEDILRTKKEPSFAPPAEDYLPIHQRDQFVGKTAIMDLGNSVVELVFDGVI